MYLGFGKYDIICLKSNSQENICIKINKGGEQGRKSWHKVRLILWKEGRGANTEKRELILGDWGLQGLRMNVVKG